MFAVICCLQSKGKRISSRKHDDFVGFRSIRSSTSQGDGWRKAANMLAQTSHWNRVRKPAHGNSVEQKYKEILVARKKRNKRQIYGLLVNARDVCRWTKQFKSRWKKGKTGKKRWLRFRWSYVWFFCLPRRYSLVFINEGHQLELIFWYKCRSDRVEHAQNFNSTRQTR